jgi:hypothetical protein
MDNRPSARVQNDNFGRFHLLLELHHLHESNLFAFQAVKGGVTVLHDHRLWQFTGRSRYCVQQACEGLMGVAHRN